MPSLADIKDKAALGIGKAASAVGLETKLSEDISEASNNETQLCPKLTFQQRIMGFGICFLLGYLITFGSFSLFIRLVLGDPIPFVVVYCKQSLWQFLFFMRSLFYSTTLFIQP
jgi:hypothetical protein